MRWSKFRGIERNALSAKVVVDSPEGAVDVGEIPAVTLFPVTRFVQSELQLFRRGAERLEFHPHAAERLIVGADVLAASEPGERAVGVSDASSYRMRKVEIGYKFTTILH